MTKEGLTALITNFLTILLTVLGLFWGAYTYLKDKEQSKIEKQEKFEKELINKIDDIEKHQERTLQDYKTYNDKRFYEYREQTNVTLQEIKGDITFLRRNTFFITNEFKKEDQKIRELVLEKNVIED